MTELFVDLNGHNRSGTAGEIPLSDLSVFSKWVAADIERGHALSARTFTRDQIIGLPAMTSLDRCGCCGASIGLQYKSMTDDKVVLQARAACAYPDGVPPYDLMLGVPSGKIVFANDLRELVAVGDDSGELNSQAGQKQFSEAFIRAGLVYVFVGNSCPSVQRDGDGLKVGSFYLENEEELTDEEYEAAEAAMDALSLGSICTDLWAYNAMDYDYFHERMKRCGIDPNEFRSHFVVEVPPGVYAFSDEFADTHAATVFSRIRRIEGAEYPTIDPGDIESHERFADSHAAKSVLTKKAHRPTGLWQLEDMLCSLGMGYDWTDGFLRRGTRREDEPFAQSIKDYRKATDYDLAQIVHFTRFPVKSIYSMSNSYGGHNIQMIPECVDVWWLTLAAMFAKTALAHPAAFDRPPRQGDNELQRAQESARSYEAMATAALMIGDLIHKRGIDIRPYCEEINAHFAAKGVFDGN